MSHVRACHWLGIIVAALVIWAVGWAIQLPLLSACDSDCATFGDYVGRDPLCAIDPTCISPLYNPNATGVQNWVGLNGWRLELGQFPAPGDKVLAPPNYILFMITVTGAVLYIVRRRWGRALTVLFVWCALQITSWFIFAAMSDPTLNLVVVLEACVVLLISLLWLAVAVSVARRFTPNTRGGWV